MEELISLTATARLIKQLGDQLISDEMVAITELIKNSYDADATKVDVIVDTEIETEYGKGKIIIKDNGNGMVLSIIKNSFLKLSTGFKEVEKISPYFKRRVLGKKGIGRLSFQRLGKFIKVYTTPRIKRLTDSDLIQEEDKAILELYNKFYIEMDWYNLDFDLDFKNIKSKIVYEKDEYVEYGTYIEILGINNLDYWMSNNKKEVEMKKNLSAMINPFLKDKKSRFSATINIDGNEIKSDMFDEETLQKTCDCEVSFKFDNWKLDIDIKRTGKYFSLTIDERIKRLKEFKLIHNEYEKSKEIMLDKYHEEISINFLDIDKFRKEFSYCKNINFDTVNLNGNNIYANPGIFEGKVYAINRKSNSYNLLDSIVESRTLLEYGVQHRKDVFNVWDSANGIYVFRNDFRILPYGDGDWNNLGRISQRSINNIFKPHNVSGYIQLDGTTSEKLEEQTNRLGLIEDQYGNNFFTIINSVLIEIITRSDAEFIDGFNLSKQTYDNLIMTTNEKIVQHEESKKEQFIDLKSNLSLVKNDLIKETKDNYNQNLGFFDAEDRVKVYKNLSNKITNIEGIVIKLKEEDDKERQKLKQEKFIAEQKLEELQDLYPLIAQGIIVETMTHELNKIEKNIKYYSSESINLLYAKDYMKENIVSNLKSIIDETYFLREQLHHLEPTYTKNRAKIENIDIKEFLESVYSEIGPMYRKANDKKVNIIIEGQGFVIRGNKGYLITIFDNLYWVEFGAKEKYIKFIINSNNSSIIVEDSGPGVDNRIEKLIFEPFITMKPQNEGRGLGLYIIRELLLSMNCDISLVGERTEGRLKQFMVDLDGIRGENK